MKILAVVHGYFPNHNAGAEAMLHQILIDLKGRGHEVKVMTKNPGAEEYEGITLYDATTKNEKILFPWTDVIFTHLDLTRYAVANGLRYNKPIVHLVHNDRQLTYNKIKSRDKAHLVIANSDWIAKTIPSKINCVTVHPPTKPDRYEVKTSRESIVLVNMNEAKGGKVFWQLARIFPDKHFIGVKGAYGNQIEYDKKLKNVTILENTPDIQKVYKKARIVIMPSSYESWGRVASEACCSGIPVIAAPTPGLKESLGEAGVFAECDNIADWVEAIRLLDDDKVYDKYSKLGKKRAKELADKFDTQMDELEKALLGLFTNIRK